MGVLRCERGPNLVFGRPESTRNREVDHALAAGPRSADSSNNRALSHWWISAGRSYLRGATGRIHLELGATITFQIIARLAVAALRSDPDPGVREAAKKTLSLVQ